MEKKFEMNEVIEALEHKGAVNPCHRCGNRSFSVLDGFSKLPALLPDFSMMEGMVVGGPLIPVIYIACNNCGAVTPHAIGSLGLLEENSNSNETERKTDN